MNKLTKLFLLGTLVFSLTACSGSDTKDTEKQEDTPVSIVLSEPVHEVRNDNTGNWKYITISDSISPEDYAVDFYNDKIKGTEDVYFVVNFANGTTTQISEQAGNVWVRTTEYVDKEEHDASTLASGALLSEKYYDPETGEEVNF